MAPGSGVHLNCTGPGSPDALSVEGRFLIALDNADGMGGAQLSNGAFQEGSLARSRRAHQVQRGDVALGEPVPIVLGEVVVLGKDRLADDQILSDRSQGVRGVG